MHAILNDEKQDEENTPSKPLLLHGVSTISSKYLAPVLGIMVTLLAFILNVFRLGEHSIWFDEAFSVELARLPLPDVIHIITHQEANMELYYVFLHFWLKGTELLGLHPTEVVVRAPSAFFATLSTLFVFLIGRRYINTWGGFVAAMLFSLNTIQLVYAQQTRSYALEVFLHCIGWFALFNALTTTEKQRTWWISYVITMALSVYAHLFSFLVIASQLIAIAGIWIIPNAWQASAQKQVKTTVIAGLVLGILCIPMVLASTIGAKTGWLPSPALKDIYHLFVTISGHDKRYFLAVIATISLGALLILGAYLTHVHPALKSITAHKLPQAEHFVENKNFLPLLWVLFCWLSIPLVLSFLISQTETRLFSSRYLVVIIPALYLLAALSVYVLRYRIIQVLVSVVFILMASITMPYYYRSAQVEDWRPASQWLVQRYQALDGLLCFNNAQGQGCQIALEYYLHAYPANGAQFSEDTPGLFTWQKFNYDTQAKALDTDELQTFAKNHPRIFYVVARLANEQDAQNVEKTITWLDTTYDFVEEIKTPTVTIRLYDTVQA